VREPDDRFKENNLPIILNELPSYQIHNSPSKTSV